MAFKACKSTSDGSVREAADQIVSWRGVTKCTEGQVQVEKRWGPLTSDDPPPHNLNYSLLIQNCWFRYHSKWILIKKQTL